MVTPGIRAPVASETVPPTVASVVWANALNDKSAQQRSTAVENVNLVISFPLLLSFGNSNTDVHIDYLP
jgi:hypothetical protein